MIALILAASLTAPRSDGALISLADGKRVMAAAEAEAARLKAAATIVIVDRYGELVLAQVAADAPGSAYDAALKQARSTINREPASSPPSAGGAPLVSAGKIVGAIGDAGAGASLVAKAGAEALK